jgi:hypothetical protein
MSTLIALLRSLAVGPKNKTQKKEKHEAINTLKKNLNSATPDRTGADSSRSSLNESSTGSNPNPGANNAQRNY